MNLTTMLSYIPYSLQFYILHGHETNERRNTYGAVCFLIFHAVVTFSSNASSVWLTVAVAVFRYLQLTSAARDINIVNMTIIGLVLLSIPMNLPQCLLFNVRIHNDSATNTSWYFLAVDSTAYGNPKVISMVQFSIAALLVKVTPCLLLFILSILLIRIIRQAHNKYVTMHQSNAVTYQPTANQRMRHKQTQQTTRMLVAIVMIFILIELPQGVIFVMSGLLKHFSEKIYWPLGNFLDLLTILGCCINFLLYCCMSSQFCQQLVSLIKSVIPNK